jgi:hypothetical protein
VTTGPQATPPGERSARQITEPLRELAALVLVGATAVFLLVSVIRLIPTSALTDTAGRRAHELFGDFVGLPTILFPLLAVLLVTHVGRPTGRARLITTVAVAEYAVAAFFGVVFGFFVGLVWVADAGFRVAFEHFLAKAAWLAVLAVAAYAVFQLWRGLFPRAPKPAPQTYGTPYGQPQQGQPQPWGQQAPPPGQWGQQAPPPPPGHWGEPTQVTPPGQWGEPAPLTPPPGQWGPPSSAPPAHAPQSAPPQQQPNGPYPPAGPYQPPQAQYGYGQQPPGGPGGAFTEPTEMYGRRPYPPDDDPTARR